MDIVEFMEFRVCEIAYTMLFLCGINEHEASLYISDYIHICMQILGWKYKGKTAFNFNIIYKSSHNFCRLQIWIDSNCGDFQFPHENLFLHLLFSEGPV